MNSGANETIQERYFNWLTNRVSPAQLSELYWVYDEIEKYFIGRKVLKDPLFQTTDTKILAKIHATIEGNKFFRITHKHKLSRMSSAIRHYIEFIQDTPNLLNNPTRSPRTGQVPAAGQEGEGASGEQPRQAAAEIQENQDEQDKTETVDLSDERDYAFTVPISFSYFGEVTNVKSWKGLYVKCMEILLDDYPSVIQSLRGSLIFEKGRIDINNRAGAAFMTAPRRIADDIFIETNYSATDIAKRLRRLIGMCNVDYENLQITIRHKPPSEHSPASAVASEKSGSQSIKADSIKTGGASEFSRQSNTRQATREKGGNAIPQDVARNYTALLRDEFPDGFRLNYNIHNKKFIRKYEERFGAINATPDNLPNQLRQVGVVRDGRIYPRQDGGQETLTDEIIETVSGVFRDGGTCVYLSKILERYRQQLGERLSIYNEDALQASLLENNSSNYLFRYGCICESAEKADPAHDVLSFMQSRHTAVNYDEIQSALWYLPMDKIKHILVTTQSLVNVDHETYFYAPNLPIGTDELQTLARVMNEEIGVKGFLVGKDLKNLIDKYCPSAAIDLADMKDWAIRNCLGYLLGDRFTFKGALITQKGHPFSTAEAYRDFCRRHETLTLDQLKEFSAEIGLPIYWENVLTDMVRISADEMRQAYKIHFNVDETDAVLDTLCPGDYIPLKEITLYLQFPAIEVPWNIFVLECYLLHYSKRFKAVQPAITGSGVYGVMARKECKFNTYDEVITDILARNDTWKDKDSAVYYLISRGLQAKTKLMKANEIMKKALLLREEAENKKK